MNKIHISLIVYGTILLYLAFMMTQSHVTLELNNHSQITLMLISSMVALCEMIRTMSHEQSLLLANKNTSNKSYFGKENQILSFYYLCV